MGSPDRGTRSGARGIAIRRAEPADAEGLWGLVHAFASYEKMEDACTGSSERLASHAFGRAWPAIDCLVAVDEGRLVGYAIFYGIFSTFWAVPMVWLEDLFVIDSHRGQGVGRALLASVARIAVERGCPRVDWGVLEWNHPAIAFYERLGATRNHGWHAYRVSGELLEALAREAQGPL